MTRSLGLARRAAALCLVGLAAAAHAGASSNGSVPIASVQTGALESVGVRVHTIKELKSLRAFRRTLHQQYDFSCGSAALATLLTFQYDRPVDETAVFQAMFAVGDQAQIRSKGFSLLDMKRFLESAGYQADGVRAPLETLVQVGVPAIALISDRGYRHFVVVKGFQADRVLIGDPALGTRLLSRRDFEKARAADIFFVIRSHRDKAHFNSSADWQAMLHAGLADSIDRNGLGVETLTIPSENRF